MNGSGNSVTQGSDSTVTTNDQGQTDVHVVGDGSTPYSSYDDVSGAGINTQRITTFADNSHSTEIWDSQGNESWNKQDVLFGSNGVLQFIKTDFNNGSWVSTAFSDPNTSSYYDSHTGTYVSGVAAYSEVFNRFGTELGLNIYGANNQVAAQFGGSSGSISQFLTQQAASVGNGQQVLSAFNSDNGGKQGIFGNPSSQIGGAFGNANLGVADTAGKGTGESQASAGGSLTAEEVAHSVTMPAIRLSVATLTSPHRMCRRSTAAS